MLPGRGRVMMDMHPERAELCAAPGERPGLPVLRGASSQMYLLFCHKTSGRELWRLRLHLKRIPLKILF